MGHLSSLLSLQISYGPRYAIFIFILVLIINIYISYYLLINLFSNYLNIKVGNIIDS